MKQLKKKMLLDEFKIDLKELNVNFGQDNPAEYSDFNSILVKRIDESLFNFIPVSNDWDGSMGNSFSYHIIFADFGQGFERLDVKPEGESGSNYAHSTTETYEGETITEYFIRTEELRTPKIILVFYRSKSSWGQSGDHNTLDLIIYKKAKDDNFVLNQITKAIEKVAAEVVAETLF